MKSSVRKVGNSMGIILPPAFLKELSIEKDTEVEILLKKEGILIKPISSPRSNWDQQFLEATSLAEEPDSDFFKGMSNDFDKEEWQW